jgi:hypothetical protein
VLRLSTAALAIILPVQIVHLEYTIHRLENPNPGASRGVSCSTTRPETRPWPDVIHRTTSSKARALACAHEMRS